MQPLCIRWPLKTLSDAPVRQSFDLSVSSKPDHLFRPLRSKSFYCFLIIFWVLISVSMTLVLPPLIFHPQWFTTELFAWLGNIPRTWEGKLANRWTKTMNLSWRGPWGTFQSRCYLSLMYAWSWNEFIWFRHSRITPYHPAIIYVSLQVEFHKKDSPCCFHVYLPNWGVNDGRT